MKKLSIAVLTLLSAGFLNAQVFDFSSSNGWTHTKDSLNSPAGCSNSHSPNALGDMDISNGRLNVTNIRGFSENRYSTSLASQGRVYDRGFTVECTFHLDHTSNGKGWYPIALSSQDVSVGHKTNMTTCKERNVMDAIGIHLNTPSPGNSANPQARIIYYDDEVRGFSDRIQIAYDTDYKGILHVSSTGVATLKIKTINADGSMNLIGSVCTELAESFEGLKFLQSSTSTLGDRNRNTSGWVDDIKIATELDECCRVEIDGPSMVCENTYQDTYEIISSGDGDFEVEFIPNIDMNYTVNGNFVTVTYWGNTFMGNNNPRQYDMIVTEKCGCEEISTVKTITFYPWVGADYEVYIVSHSSTNTVDVHGTSEVTAEGVEHTWVLVEEATGKVIREKFEVSTGSGSTFNEIGADPTGQQEEIKTGKDYRLYHSTNYADNPCGIETLSRLLRGNITAPNVIGPLDTDVNIGGFGRAIISPNPSTGVVKIQSEAEVRAVEVYGLDGKLVKTASKGTLVNEIDLRELSKGSYLMKMHFPTHTETRKIQLR